MDLKGLYLMFLQIHLNIGVTPRVVLAKARGYFRLLIMRARQVSTDLTPLVISFSEWSNTSSRTLFLSRLIGLFSVAYGHDDDRQWSSNYGCDGEDSELCGQVSADPLRFRRSKEELFAGQNRRQRTEYKSVSESS
jgi:hypothetical protein